MKIKRIHIQKFRSVDDAIVDFKQIIAIVGANNAGKSHVLRALNAFFNYSDERDSFCNESHRYSKQSRPRITITFDEITENDNVDDEYIFNKTLTLKFTYRWDRKIPTYEIIKGNESTGIDAETFEKLTSSFMYIYVPILRNYDAAFSSSSGIAYKLLKKIFAQQTANRNMIQPIADRLVKKVEESIYLPALNNLKKYYPFKDGNDFKMRAHSTDLIDLILRNVALILNEDSQENEIDNCGSGIQSAVFFAISLAISMTGNKNYLVGIEEPELNMHPQAQRQLIEALKENTHYPNTQFVLTTHSTVIIDRLGHESVALCKKIKGRSRDIVTTITQIPDGFWEKYQMEEERYYNFFDFKNSDFFFSNYIIISESTNDCKVIENLLELSHIDLESKGISLIPAGGETSIKYPYAIAKELQIPFVCIVDRDVFQPYLNDKREKSLDKNGIPMYKPVLKRGSSILELISSKEDKGKILDAFINNRFEEVLKILEKYNVVSMRYAFEVDLAICNSYCNAFCDNLSVKEENKHSSFLLNKHGNALKKHYLINKVLNQVGIQNLPKSYRAIITQIRKMIS